MKKTTKQYAHYHYFNMPWIGFGGENFGIGEFIKKSVWMAFKLNSMDGKPVYPESPMRMKIGGKEVAIVSPNQLRPFKEWDIDELKYMAAQCYLTWLGKDMGITCTNWQSESIDWVKIDSGYMPITITTDGAMALIEKLRGMMNESSRISPAKSEILIENLLALTLDKNALEWLPLVVDLYFTIKYEYTSHYTAHGDGYEDWLTNRFLANNADEVGRNIVADTMDAMIYKIGERKADFLIQ